MKTSTILTVVYLVLLSLTSCVQEEHLKTVTFRVDMTGITSISKVGIKGEFTDPSWRVTIPLTDENNDGVYETTLSRKTAVNNVEFKFVKDGVYELQSQKNRTLHFEYRPEILTYMAVWDIPKETKNKTN